MLVASGFVVVLEDNAQQVVAIGQIHDAAVTLHITVDADFMGDGNVGVRDAG